MNESGSPARRGRVRRFVGIALVVVAVLSWLVCLTLPQLRGSSWVGGAIIMQMVGIILAGLLGLPGLMLFDSGRTAAYVADRDGRAARLARKYAPLPWVLWVEGATPNWPSSCRLMSPSVVIGSRPKSYDPDAQYVDIDDPGLAPTCARLDLKGDTWYVTDLSSSTSVVVLTPDGIPVTIARDAPAPVYGDIKIGRLTLRVESTTGSTSTGPSLTDPDWGSSASVGPPDFSQSDQSTTGSSFGHHPTVLRAPEDPADLRSLRITMILSAVMAVVLVGSTTVAFVLLSGRWPPQKKPVSLKEFAIDHTRFSVDGVEVDDDGNLFLISSRWWSGSRDTSYGAQVVKVTPGGSASVFAGTGAIGFPESGPAVDSQLTSIGGHALDAAGNLYLVDSASRVVVKVTPDGTLSVVAGNGEEGDPVPGLATASPLRSPSTIVFDAAGNLYLDDRLSDTDRFYLGYPETSDTGVVVMVTPDGTLSVVAGNGEEGDPVPGLATASPLRGRGETFTMPQVCGGGGLVVDSDHNLYIVDTGAVGDTKEHMRAEDYFSRVLKVTDGTLSLVAGNGENGSVLPGPAGESPLGYVSSLEIDRAGNLYFGLGRRDLGRVSPDQTLSVFAADEDLSGGCMGVDSAGNIYGLSERGRDMVVVAPDGTVSVTNYSDHVDYNFDGTRLVVGPDGSVYIFSLFDGGLKATPNKAGDGWSFSTVVYR